MSETYNRKQAMERLGILSINSFLFLQRKYPDVFVIVNQGPAAEKKPLYDKDTIDNFARRRAYFKQSATGERT
jgi:hypothetical protein